MTGESGPTIKQAQFLLLDEIEAFYGGAAGGGKSDALLMGALQYVDVPGYTAILFRRTFKDLALPDSLMDRAQQWLAGTPARWKGDTYTYTFPSTAKVVFAYLAHERDKYRYQSAAFQYVGFDEVSQFTETQYLYLFSRLRRLEGVYIPLRMRSAANPGGEGHEWVKERFIPEDYDHLNPRRIYRKDVERPDGTLDKVVFIPARLTENPYLDRESYTANLNRLDPVTRERLLKGDWDIQDAGAMFQRNWFEKVKTLPYDSKGRIPPEMCFVRYWDLAATEPIEGSGGYQPAWTAGALVALYRGIFYLLDIQRKQYTPHKVEDLVRNTAKEDARRYGHYRVDIWMEEEPGSAGKNTIDHYSRYVLTGYPFHGYKETGNKELRAKPIAAAAERGEVKIKEAPWNKPFLDEVVMFPRGFKDQVDAAGGAIRVLANVARPPKVRYR